MGADVVSCVDMICSKLPVSDRDLFSPAHPSNVQRRGRWRAHNLKCAFYGTVVQPRTTSLQEQRSRSGAWTGSKRATLAGRLAPKRGPRVSLFVTLGV